MLYCDWHSIARDDSIAEAAEVSSSRRGQEVEVPDAHQLRVPVQFIQQSNAYALIATVG